MACSDYQLGDSIVIACNHGAAPTVSFGWRGPRLVIRSGRNGADLALLEAMEEENIPGRFSEAVVASGDGIFAEAVARLEALEVPVTVVHPIDGLSARLKLASSRQVPLAFDAPREVRSVRQAA